MSYPPLILTKRLVKGSKITPAENDQNYSDIETAINGFDAKLAVALNPNGTIKNNAVSTAALQDRSVTLPKLAFLDQFYAVDTGAANAAVITFAPDPLLGAYAAGLVFWVKIVADNTGAATLAVDGLGPKNIKIYTASGIGDPFAGAMKAGGVYVFVYDGTNFVLLNATPIPAGATVTNVDAMTLDARVTAAADLTFAHGFTGIPFSHWSLLCIIADAGFVVNDELDLPGIWVETPGNDYEPVASTWVNGSVVGAAAYKVEAGNTVLAYKGGLEVTLNPLNWALKNRAKMLF